MVLLVLLVVLVVLVIEGEERGGGVGKEGGG